MALKAVLSKAEVDALPEALRGVYKDTNGTFNLDAAVLALANDGMVPDSDYSRMKTGLAEFRDNNIALIKERDSVTTKLKGFDGVDVTEYHTLKEGAAKLKKVGIDKTDDLAALIAEQVSKAIKPVQDNLNTMTQERETLKKQVAASAVDDHIRTAALAAGARENAIDDILNRGRKVFQSEDGKVVAKDGDKPRFSAADPAKQLGAEEWVSDLAKTNDFLFKPSGGGGAGGGGGGGGGGKTVLTNPSRADFSKNLEAIANGTIEVRQ
jgi:hypothetical protein